MTLSRVRISLAIGCFLLLQSVVPATAQSNDDLFAKGQAAMAKGDSGLVEAQAAFCAIKDQAYKNGDAKVYCSEATRSLNRFNQNYIDGMTLMQEGKYDQAEVKLKNVKAGSRVADAQAQLAKIPALKQAKAAADAQASQSAAVETASKTRLDAGIEAYNRGDFTGAKTQLDGVSGSYQGQAQNYLNKINSYSAKMSEARGYEAARNFQAASNAYAEAARISSNGPGDPLGQVTRMATLAASVGAPPTTATAPKSTGKASKDEVKTVDVAAYIKEGQKQLARGDLKKARRYFGDVLAQDPNNDAAAQGMKDIKARDTSTGPAEASDDDPLLASAIRKFYDGDYDGANYNLQKYVYDGLGKKMGLANFYWGATSLSLYYLRGATDSSLMTDAKRKFREAKGVQGFVAPEKMVSPKILKVFQEAS